MTRSLVLARRSRSRASSGCCLFVVVPAYAVLAMAMGKVNLLLQPVPAWNPLDWNLGFVSKAFSGALPGGDLLAGGPQHDRLRRRVARRCASRSATRSPTTSPATRKKTKALLIVLLVIPFWVSYLLRMLAWIGLLSSDGYVNKLLIDIGIAHPPDWLNGNPYSVIIALVYGYIPYFILPVFAGLDRIDRSQIEAARDLGATPWQAFLRVTLPLSRPSILAGSALVVLPMFGDYYTNDLISASPRTNMLGNQINLFVQGGSEKNLGASLVLVLMAILAVGMALLPLRRPPTRGARARCRARRRHAACADAAAPAAQSVGPAALPRRCHLDRTSSGRCCRSLIAMLFSFNDGRSRSVWQGFSMRWWWGDPSLSIFHDPDYTNALVPQPRARGARHADRDPARRAARARAHPLARARLGRRPTG